MDEYGISFSAISMILLKQNEFLKTVDSSPGALKKSKNIRAGQHEQMEKALNEWIIKKQKVGIPLNGPLIREKAGYNKLI